MFNYIIFKKGVYNADNSNLGNICNASCPTNKGINQNILSENFIYLI